MTELEFSRKQPVDHLPPGGKTVKIEANEQERAALAKRFDLLTLDGFTARFRLIPVAGGSLVRVEGKIEAELTQACVVTLDPVAAQIEEEFELAFGPDDGSVTEDVLIEMGEEDPPEPIEHGMVELGEVAAQQLSLSVDPFPRSPGAELPDAGQPDPSPSAFAGLSAWKKK